MGEVIFIYIVKEDKMKAIKIREIAAEGIYIKIIRKRGGFVAKVRPSIVRLVEQSTYPIFSAVWAQLPIEYEDN